MRERRLIREWVSLTRYVLPTEYRDDAMIHMLEKFDRKIAEGKCYLAACAGVCTEAIGMACYHFADRLLRVPKFWSARRSHALAWHGRYLGSFLVAALVIISDSTYKTLEETSNYLNYSHFSKLVFLFAITQFGYRFFVSGSFFPIAFVFIVFISRLTAELATALPNLFCCQKLLELWSNLMDQMVFCIFFSLTTLIGLLLFHRLSVRRHQAASSPFH